MKRKSRRKWWTWPARWGPRKAPKYADHKALHAYEDAVVYALLRERGSGSASEWTAREPDRWNAKCLLASFERIRLAHPSSIVRERHWHSWGRRYSTAFVCRDIPKQQLEEVA